MSTMRAWWNRLRQDWRERWQWYRAQRQVPRERHWWDAYNL